MSDAAQQEFLPEPTAPVRPRVVALLNQKGGVGKTTSTVNLGAALARFGRRVLLLDLDPQSNLSLHFGVEPREDQPSVYELLMDDAVRVEDVVVNARPGLDFVPAVTELALVEGQLANRPDMQHVLRKKLEPVFGRYDVVLLDCPPSLGVLSVNALTVADEVFVPMQAHYLPLRGLEKLLQTVHLVSQGLNPGIRVTGILLCMHEAQSSHGRAVIDELQSQLQQYRGSGLPWQDAHVLAPPVRRNIKLAEAPSFGLTIFDYSPRCPGADDYRQLAEALLERWGVKAGEFDGARARNAPPEDAVAGDGGAKPTKRRRRSKQRAAPVPPAPAVRGKRRSKAHAKQRASSAIKSTAKSGASSRAKALGKSTPKPSAKTSKGSTAKASAKSKSRSGSKRGAKLASKPGLKLGAKSGAKSKVNSSVRLGMQNASALKRTSSTARARRGARAIPARRPARRSAGRALRSGGLSL